MHNNANVSYDCKKILLIQTGTPPDVILNEQGDLPLWFGQLLAPWKNQFTVVKIFLGEELPPPNRNTVAVITGSWAMVTEKRAWSEKAALWIREAMKIGMPLFGVCYGHQLMAYALGGDVDYNATGRELGSKTIELANDATADPLLQGFPKAFSAFLSHLQTVVRLPPGATSLATSDQDQNQIIKYSAHAYSTQYHPEFTFEICKSIVNSRFDILVAEGSDPNEIIKNFKDSPFAGAVLKQFIKQYVTPLER